MKQEKFDRKKVIAEMKALRAKRIAEITELNSQHGIETDQEELSSEIVIKYLGKMELVNEQGELVEKNVYMTIEQIDGQFQMRYYDENQNMLGIQRAIDDEIILTSSLSGASEKEQTRIQNELQEKDKEEAKTQEELEQEQAREEREAKKEGPQLTQKQVNSLDGPTVALSQQVDDMTLGNKIGVEGQFIKFVDIDEAKKLVPDLERDELGQKFIPLVIAPDGTANVVPEENLKFSTIKGTHSTEKSITENNDGTRNLDQGIVTFEIPGTHNFITVGFNEQHTSDPYYELKFQTIDRDSNKLGGEELQQQYVGTIEDPTAHNERRINTEGQLKYTKELVTEEQAEKFAKATGIFINGRELDKENAKLTLERLSVGGKTVNEIIAEAENEQMVPGPSEGPRSQY